MARFAYKVCNISSLYDHTWMLWTLLTCTFDITRREGKKPHVNYSDNVFRLHATIQTINKPLHIVVEILWAITNCISMNLKTENYSVRISMVSFWSWQGQCKERTLASKFRHINLLSISAHNNAVPKSTCMQTSKWQASAHSQLDLFQISRWRKKNMNRTHTPLFRGCSNGQPTQVLPSFPHCKPIMVYENSQLNSTTSIPTKAEITFPL